MNNGGRYRKAGKDFLRIILGTVLMALAVNLVYEPLGMVSGGVSGFAIVIKRVSQLWLPFEIPVWLTNFVVNIPIFLVAYRMKGKSFLRKTLLANLLFTTFMFFLPQGMEGQKDYLLAAVAGGVLNGAGLGLIFSTGSSTGGTDLLSVIVNHVLPHYTVAKLLFILDTVIILAGAYFFGIPVAIYAGISVFLTSRIMDAMIEGVKFAKLAYVVSDNYDKIGKEIMRELGRGVTALDSKGMYTGKNRLVLLCVVSKKEIVKLTRIARRYDPAAFVIISDAREVLGEGFVENRQ